MANGVRRRKPVRVSTDKKYSYTPIPELVRNARTNVALRKGENPEDYSQRSFATELGVSYTTVSGWERPNSKTFPTIPQLAAVCWLNGKTTDEFAISLIQSSDAWKHLRQFIPDKLIDAPGLSSVDRLTGEIDKIETKKLILLQSQIATELQKRSAEDNL